MPHRTITRREACLKHATAYAATAVVFLSLDSLWLFNTGKVLYRERLGDLFLPEFNLSPAIAFYVVYIAAILIFATSRAAETGRWSTGLFYGAMFGFASYATYDLTNQATLRGWPLIITLADLCWGTFVTGVAAAAGFVVTRRLLPSAFLVKRS